MLICVQCGSSNGKGLLHGYYVCECDGGVAEEITATQCPMCGEITGDMEAGKVTKFPEVICRECMTRFY